jgi:methionyl-tRNA synthetase
MRLVLYVTIETLRIAAILLQPVLPEAMARLLDLLAIPPEARYFSALGDAREFGRLIASHRLKPGVALPSPAPIFPRVVEPETEAP